MLTSQSGPAVSSQDAAAGKPKIALCLSGGGFRATLFHLGVIRRLNEFGLLSRLDVISSVSGGSILNGVLATRWPGVTIAPSGVITNFDEMIALPVRRFCATDIRTPLLIGTRINPANWPALLRDFFSVSAGYLAKSYQPLYLDKKLSEVPPPGENIPRFVFCATNMLTGACWHFHGGPQGRMGDFYTGYCDTGDVNVSDAVAASSAFTPGFSALRLRFPKNCKLTRIDPWNSERPISAKRSSDTISQKRMEPILTDGGVYDNLGVEPVWGRQFALLVSDAGAPFFTADSNSQFFGTRLRRAIDISLEQVGAVRKRWLVNDFVGKRQVGALWAINTLLEDFSLPDARGYPATVRRLLQRIRTDLNSFTEGEIACLENHGYSLADAAIRSRAPSLCPNMVAPFQWPNKRWIKESMACNALAQSYRRNMLRDIGWYFIHYGLP